MFLNVTAAPDQAASELLAACLAALRGRAGVAAEVAESPEAGWARLRIAGEAFDADVRPRVPEAAAHVAWELAARGRSEGRRPVLVTEFVGDRLGELLRTEGVGYLDAAGNASLTAPPLFVLIRGMKPRPAKASAPSRGGGRAFRPAGLRVIARLLADPEAVRLPYRDLAEAAGVSVGAAAAALKGLQRHGLARRPGGRGKKKALGGRLNDPVALHRRWLDGYGELLRPKLNLGRYRPAGWPLDELPTALAALPATADVMLGGEAAAALLTRHLRPATAALHVPPDTSPGVAKTLRLLPDRDGPIWLLAHVGTPAGWRFNGEADLPAGVPVVHPLLVHAELTGPPGGLHPESRLREAAEQVYAKFLLPAFEAEAS